MKGSLLKEAAYAARLSFLGLLSKHHSAGTEQERVFAITKSATLSLRYAFYSELMEAGISRDVAAAALEDFTREITKYPAQLNKELTRVLWSRRTNASTVSFIGRVSDGRNSRLFEDMIELTANMAMNTARAVEAWTRSTGEVEVLHNGITQYYKPEDAVELIEALEAHGHLHPRSTAVFTPVVTGKRGLDA